jgi:hypothetical protein
VMQFTWAFAVGRVMLRLIYISNDSCEIWVAEIGDESQSPSSLAG